MMDLATALSELRRESGVTFAGVRRLLCRLTLTRSDRVGDLVEATGVPHRRVVEVLRRLGFATSDESIGVGEGDRQELRRLLGCGEDARHNRLAEVLEGVAAGLPPAVWSLDHVPATIATIVARAQHLVDRYDLAAAHLVCLGDHDLTAIATKLLVPEATVSVVDIDERLLEYLDSVSDRLGLDVRLYAADLRLGLPRALVRSADVIFTDPPYSAEGVGVFLRRGVQALGDRPGASILFCYGTGDRGAERLLDVQDRLGRLHLALEALLPGFNRYHGAHAIGGASALWVVRPSKRTRAAVAAVEAKAGEARIYSRGNSSRESAVPALPEGVLSAVGEAVWVDPREVIQAVTDPPTSGSRRRWVDTIAVNLGQFYGSSITQLLMAAAPGSRLLLVGDARAFAIAQENPAARLAAARFAVEVLINPAPLGVLWATPVTPDNLDDAAWVLRYLQEHHGAALRNAWREGLCALAERHGATCTKNEARTRIDATSMRPAELDGFLLHLPSHRLSVLLASVDQSVESVISRD